MFLLSRYLENCDAVLLRVVFIKYFECRLMLVSNVYCK